MKRMRIALPLLLAATSVTVRGQDYPTKSVRMVVPFPPGSSNDIMARLLPQKLAEFLGQQFIIDNCGGAGGVIGAPLTFDRPDYFRAPQRLQRYNGANSYF